MRSAMSPTAHLLGQHQSYAEEVIPVIREQKPDAVILVGTPTWSQEIDKAASSPLTFDNVMYTLHFTQAPTKMTCVTA